MLADAQPCTLFYLHSSIAENKEHLEGEKMKQDSSREGNFNSNQSFQQFSGLLPSQPQQAISMKKRYRLGSHRVHDCKIKMSKKEKFKKQLSLSTKGL